MSSARVHLCLCLFLFFCFVFTGSEIRGTYYVFRIEIIYWCVEDIHVCVCVLCRCTCISQYAVIFFSYTVLCVWCFSETSFTLDELFVGPELQKLVRLIEEPGVIEVLFESANSKQVTISWCLSA